MQSRLHRQYIVGFLLAILPFLDRTLSELILGTRAISIADMMIPPLFIGALIEFRNGYPKRLLSFLFLIVLLSGLFILGETREGPQYISIRQGISILLAGAYAAAVALYIGKFGYRTLFRLIIALALFNSILTILAGFYPDLFSDFLYRVTEAGRSFAGIRLPFVRNSGLFGHYGYHGAYILLAIAALYILKSDQAIEWRFPWLIVLLMAIVVTQSRATWISTVILFFGLLVLKPYVPLSGVHRMRHMWTILLMICVPFLALFAMNLVEYLVEARERTFYSRLSSFEDALHLFLDSPILGKGYGAYYIAEQTHVLHNMTITVAYSTGVVGLALFMLLLFRPLFWSMPASTRAVLVSLMLSVYVLLNASSGLSYYSLWLNVGVVMGFGFLHRRTLQARSHARLHSTDNAKLRPNAPSIPGPV